MQQKEKGIVIDATTTRRSTMPLKADVVRARGYRERLIPKGFTLTRHDVQWIKGLSMCLGASESQILRGILARAREVEIEFADEAEEAE